jgi:hypothetical protein
MSLLPSCDNCVNDAMHYVSDPGANPVRYCGDCLPASLSARAADGQFPLPEAELDVIKSKKTARAKAAEVVEAPVDTPAEVVETPAE